MLFAVWNYDKWENSLGPVLRITGINEDGEELLIDVQDPKFTPRLYIRKIDFHLYKKIVKESGLEKFVLREFKNIQIKSMYDEELVKIEMLYPRHVGYVRKRLEGILTFQADVKWEKMCFQEMKWTQFLEIKNHDPYGMTPLKNIKKTNKTFNVDYRVLYWDIETDYSEVRGMDEDAWQLANKIPIISYATFDNFTKKFVFYSWDEEFDPQEYMDKHQTNIEEKILNNVQFKDYPKEFDVIVKKFDNEKDMHEEFLNDFRGKIYAGIMTFNGRGGNMIFRGKRQWRNGYDMPLFYERCMYFSLKRELQYMSVFPVTNIYYPPVKSRVYKKTNKGQIRYEVFIKGMCQFDFYFDEPTLGYSIGKNHEMPNRKLDTYLNVFLGIHKVEHEGLSVAELMKEDWEKEKLYNIIDVEGMYALDVLLGYVRDIAERVLVFGGKMEDSVYTSKVHDHINLWWTSDNYIWDSRDNFRDDLWEGMLENKTGGYNMPVKQGAYRTCGFIIDFSKLYPSCSETANVSIRTKIDLDHLKFCKDGLYLVDKNGDEYLYNDLCRTPAGFFRKDELAIDTVIYEKLRERRNELKHIMMEHKLKAKESNNKEDKEYHKMLGEIYDHKQYAFKFLVNGKFGTTGNVYSRTYDKVVYNSPPSMGQILIKEVIKAVKLMGFDAVLSSTDSVICITNYTDPLKTYAVAQKVCETLNYVILPKYINREFNPIKNHINIGCEKVFDNSIIINKRYYMLNVRVVEDEGGVILLDNPYPYIKGMAYVRGDAADITRDVQKNVIDMFRKGKTDGEIIEYIKSLEEDFESFDWNYICSKANLKMKIENSNGQRYKAARNSNKILKKDYKAGDMPFISVFNIHPKRFKGTYIGSDPLPLLFDKNDQEWLTKCGFDIDYSILRENNLQSPIEDIVKTITGNSYSDEILCNYDLFEV